MITNKDLLKNPKTNLVRSDIIEFHDYVTIDQRTWKYLFSWYGVDYTLCINKSPITLVENIYIDDF